MTASETTKQVMAAIQDSPGIQFHQLGKRLPGLSLREIGNCLAELQDLRLIEAYEEINAQKYIVHYCIAPGGEIAP